LWWKGPEFLALREELWTENSQPANQLSNIITTTLVQTNNFEDVYGTLSLGEFNRGK
jgi:hypothetical protein